MARYDEREDERRFRGVGGRPVERGGAHASVGKLTRVALETDAATPQAWSPDGAIARAAGRNTRVAASEKLPGFEPSGGDLSSGGEPAADEPAGSEEREAIDVAGHPPDASGGWGGLAAAGPIGVTRAGPGPNREAAMAGATGPNPAWVEQGVAGPLGARNGAPGANGAAWVEQGVAGPAHGGPVSGSVLAAPGAATSSAPAMRGALEHDASPLHRPPGIGELPPVRASSGLDAPAVHGASSTSTAVPEGATAVRGAPGIGAAPPVYGPAAHGSSGLDAPAVHGAWALHGDPAVAGMPATRGARAPDASAVLTPSLVHSAPPATSAPATSAQADGAAVTHGVSSWQGASTVQGELALHGGSAAPGETALHGAQEPGAGARSDDASRKPEVPPGDRMKSLFGFRQATTTAELSPRPRPVQAAVPDEGVTRGVPAPDPATRGGAGPIAAPQTAKQPGEAAAEPPAAPNETHTGTPNQVHTGEDASHAPDATHPTDEAKQPRGEAPPNGDDRHEAGAHPGLADPRAAGLAVDTTTRLQAAPEGELAPKYGRVSDGLGLGLVLEPQLQQAPPGDPRQHKPVADPTMHLVDPRRALTEPSVPFEQLIEQPPTRSGQPPLVEPKLKGLELKTRSTLEREHAGEPQHPPPGGDHAGGGHAGGHAMAKPAPARPTSPDPKLLAQNQQALNAYIATSEAARAKAKDEVQQQKLAKASAAQVDAKVIAARVKALNDAKLAKQRADAQHDRVATAQAAQVEKHDGQVTLESLRTKLEDKLSADKQQFTADFERKKQELAARLETQKQVLSEQAAAQINNLRTQQQARAADAKARWESQKASFQKQAEDLMVQMRHQMEADKTRLQDQQKQAMKLASEKGASVENEAKAKAEHLIEHGNAEAADKSHRCIADGNAAYVSAQARAGREEDENKKAQILAGGAARRRDLAIKADLVAKDIKAKAASEAQKVRDAGAAQKKQLIETADRQVKAIDDKINSLAALAQKRVAEGEKALQAKLKAGQDALDKKLDDLQKAIDKKQNEAADKIKKLEDDGARKLQTEYDRELKAIDQRTSVARHALAHGSQKDIARIERVVDSTLTSIDRSIAASEKKLDAEIADAERHATAVVTAALKSIKAEVDKLLADIDREYDAQIKAVQDAVDNARKQIDETARGKMLEIEVHVATMCADLGDKSRLDAVKEQLRWYVKNKQSPPPGFGEVAQPAPLAPAAGKAGAAPGGKTELIAERPQDGKQGADGAKRTKDAAEQDKEEDAQVAALLKKGQSATVAAAETTARAAVDLASTDGLRAVDNVVKQKTAEIENMEAGGPDAQVEQYKIDQKKGQDAADQIAAAASREGLFGKSPDKKAILQALAGKTPAQTEALRAALLARTPPIDINAIINNTLSGEEQKEAQIRMQGNSNGGDIHALLGAAGWKPTGNQKSAAVGVGAAVAGPVGVAGAGVLVDAFSGAGVDKDRIEEILAQHQDPAERAAFAEAFERETGRSFNDFLKQNDPAAAEAFHADKTPEAIEREQKQAALLKQAEADPTLQKRAAESITQLRDALDNFHVDGTRADLVAKALDGKSEAEIALIMARYKQEPGGEDLQEKLRTMMSGPALAQAEATLRNDPEQIAVSKLMGAEASSWTPSTVDDKKLQDTLEGLTDPEQRRKVLEMYKAQTGVDLQDVISQKMTGNDRELAKCLANGDTNGANAIKVNEATNGGWLNAMQDAAAARFGIPKEVTQGITNTALFGVPGALLPEGANITVDGYSIGDGGIHKVDSDQIFKVLESIKDPADRAELARRYKDATGKDLDADMNAKLGTADRLGSGAKYDAYQALMDGDYDKAAACEAKAALSDGIAQDKEAFYKQLEGKSEWERQRVIAAFNQQYGNGNPAAFQNFYNGKLGGLDVEKADLLAHGEADPATGIVELPPEFEIKYAMDSVWVKAAKTISGGTQSADEFFAEHPLLRVAAAIATVGGSEVMLGEAKAAAWMMSNWGVDEDKVLSVMREHPELAQTLDPSLKAEIQSTLSGRSLAEAQFYLDRGVPQTPEEQVQFQLAMYQFDRGGSNALSQGLTDAFSVSGKDYDTQYQQLLVLQQQIEACKAAGVPIPDELAARAGWATAMSSSTGEQYDKDKSKVANTAATAVGVVVGAAATALTGGAAGAVLGALLAGATTIGTKQLLLGDSYKKGELGVDVAMTLVNAVTAGVLKAEPFKAFCEGLTFMSKGGQQLLQTVISGASAAAVSSMVQTMITSKDAHDLLGLLGQGARAGLWGAVTGGANAAAVHALDGLLGSLSEKLFGTNATDKLGKAYRDAGVIETMLKGYLSGGGGALASMAVEAIADPEVLSGNWDTVLANALQRFHDGGFQNAVQSGADKYYEKYVATVHEATAAAKQAQAEGASPEAQREAFAEHMAQAAQAEAAQTGQPVEGQPLVDAVGAVGAHEPHEPAAAELGAAPGAEETHGPGADHEHATVGADEHTAPGADEKAGHWYQGGKDGHANGPDLVPGFDLNADPGEIGGPSAFLSNNDNAIPPAPGVANDTELPPGPGPGGGPGKTRSQDLGLVEGLVPHVDPGNDNAGPKASADHDAPELVPPTGEAPAQIGHTDEPSGLELDLGDSREGWNEHLGDFQVPDEANLRAGTRKPEFGAPSTEPGGTEHHTGMNFHEYSAAEAAIGLRVDWDPQAGRPRSVTYDFASAAASVDSQATDRSFHQEPRLKGESAQSRDAAYTGSGYDRGHLAQREAGKVDPATDAALGLTPTPRSDTVERALDVLTNVVPMTPALNQGTAWRAAEARTAQLALEHGYVTVTVTPIYDEPPPRLSDGTPIPSQFRRTVVSGTTGEVLDDQPFDNR
jgi:hypothetical protein